MPDVMLNGRRHSVRTPALTGRELKHTLGLKQSARLFVVKTHRPGVLVNDTDRVIIDGTVKVYTEGP